MNDNVTANLHLECASERILKIGQHFGEVMGEIIVASFFDSQCLSNSFPGIGLTAILALG